MGSPSRQQLMLPTDGRCRRQRSSLWSFSLASASPCSSRSVCKLLLHPACCSQHRPAMARRRCLMLSTVTLQVGMCMAGQQVSCANPAHSTSHTAVLTHQHCKLLLLCEACRPAAVKCHCLMRCAHSVVHCSHTACMLGSVGHRRELPAAELQVLYSLSQLEC